MVFILLVCNLLIFLLMDFFILYRGMMMHSNVLASLVIGFLEHRVIRVKPSKKVLFSSFGCWLLDMILEMK